MDERFTQKVRPPRRVKVAVVGSGLAGLTAAYLLSSAPQRTDIQHGRDGPVEFEVHIFEKVGRGDAVGSLVYKAFGGLPR
jgi:uncharacterized protein with NAD-binding domain and iron-sulfur cluster